MVAHLQQGVELFVFKRLRERVCQRLSSPTITDEHMR